MREAILQSMKLVAQTLQQSKQKAADECGTFPNYLASEFRAMDNISMARRIKLKLNRFYLDYIVHNLSLTKTMEVQLKLNKHRNFSSNTLIFISYLKSFIKNPITKYFDIFRIHFLFKYVLFPSLTTIA